MDPLYVTHEVLRCWRAGVWGGLGAGGTTTLQALGLSLSRPFRCAASTRLVPCLCGTPAPSGGRAP